MKTSGSQLKSLLVLIFLLLLATTLIFPQEKRITVKAVVDTLPADSRVYITGNTDELGNWLFNINEPMLKGSGDEWHFRLNANIGDTLQFKFTRGDWSTEAVD
jgi:uncharacterized membrane-anchored protein